jgi:hypothetical protein
MTFSGIFVDDQTDEAVYATNLSLAGVLELAYLKPENGADLAASISDTSPSIILIDYRLDECGSDGEIGVRYKGSALAQILRDKAIELPELDCPLVLVSAEAKIKSLYRPDKTAHDLFDRVYVKDGLNNERDRVRNELVALCEGYALLRALNQTYELKAITGLNEDEDWALDYQQLRVGIGEAKAPHIVARIILRDLIDRSGPLLDDPEMAALLGMKGECADKIAEVLTQAGIGYDGVFSGIGRRWWAHRLDQWATEVFGSRATGLTAKARTDALNEKLSLGLEAARSPWTGKDDELVAFACAVCSRPTELKHSLAAFDAERPKFAKAARICWDCIQLDKHKENDPPVLVDDNDAGIAANVATMPRPQS